jgi:hypothetical protein
VHLREDELAHAASDKVTGDGSEFAVDPQVRCVPAYLSQIVRNGAYAVERR